MVLPDLRRSLLVIWKPKFMKIVLEAGNEYVVHNASKGGLHMRPAQVLLEDDAATEEESGTLIEDARLAPYVAWMEEVGFENLWDRDV
jgi:hypothetical protein